MSSFIGLFVIEDLLEKNDININMLLCDYEDKNGTSGKKEEAFYNLATENQEDMMSVKNVDDYMRYFNLHNKKPNEYIRLSNHSIAVLLVWRIDGYSASA